jgi:hypothetical protein
MNDVLQQTKQLALEEAWCVQLASVAAAFELKSSRWNSHMGSQRCTLQVRRLLFQALPLLALRQCATSSIAVCCESLVHGCVVFHVRCMSAKLCKMHLQRRCTTYIAIVSNLTLTDQHTVHP